jgi:hypothetical protein
MYLKLRIDKSINGSSSTWFYLTEVNTGKPYSTTPLKLVPILHAYGCKEGIIEGDFRLDRGNLALPK